MFERVRVSEIQRERGGRNIRRKEGKMDEEDGEIIENDSERGGDRKTKRGHREQIEERSRKKEGSQCFPKA